MWWYVYILQCNDGKTYTGYTSNLKNRMERHREGRERWTKNRLPVKLQVAIAFRDKQQAMAFEQYLKSGSGRAFAGKHLL